MARIAILADIHGNRAALEAVFADLDEVDADEVLVAGDLVGRGPEGTWVVEQVVERGWRTLRGNHEDYVLNFKRRAVPDDWHTLERWAASRFMGDELSDDAAAWIDTLPPALLAHAAPGVRLVHGSPDSYNEGLGPWTPDDDLRRHLAGLDERVLVCAHTHRPMARRVDDALVVNTGSVGLPFNRDPRAQYVVLDDSTGRWVAHARAVDYDRDATRAAYRATGFLEAGDSTAALLLHELDAATSYLVPFLKWADRLGLAGALCDVPDFLSAFDPMEPLDRWLDRAAPVTR